ncbi:C4-dicarboxylate-specific signal transduction histidine kinase [Caldalkalibacillus uzonensis]|uniref:histidine kinase n=1 Tax=Caldalkalibacillus uzonensis TaxID=353224 RepID=A0ABU0CVR7_9BACI|nr:ATP-binding protein [Caldalkalibacillus uzonensis]MDQ0339976.1 C4-dicarboxylate-specific signal transduction histidine kinase [Caldalkalibacillus uzonensis]
MHEKQELIDRLTGIRSSRKSYYNELNKAVRELSRKNKQLKVINQLTRIHVHLSWEETSLYIASRLSQAIPFDYFALSLLEGTDLSCYITVSVTRNTQVRTWKLTGPNKSHKDALSCVNQLLEDEHERCGTTVPLPIQAGKVLGFLTLLHQAREDFVPEDEQFFRQIAEHVSVSVENILLFKDVSEKVNIEAQLVQSAKLAAIGEMAAGVAHELNSPLTAILGNVQLLMRQIKEERQAKMLRDIYQCGLRSKKIIQNLLVFSRQEEFQFEDLSLHPLIEDVLSLIGYQLKVSGISVVQKLAKTLPLVHGNRYQIEQVLINLLLNARDALQERVDPQIEIQTGTVREEGKDFVYVAVLDNGTGIEEKHLPQIFNPFFTTKGHQKGTGLGLSVSLGIAEAHQGTLRVDSQKGEYTKLTLLLPVKEGEKGDVPEAGLGRG